VESSTWLWVLFWWLAFAGSHIVLSSAPVRGAIVGRIGAGPFQGLYSLVALATFIPMVSAYWGEQNTGTMLWSLRGQPVATAAAIALGVTAFVLFVASFVQPSPTGMDPRATNEATGVSRISRHPLFAAFALWGLAHCLMNGFASDLAFFGGFIVYSVIGAAHQDSRKKSERGDAFVAYCQQTSFWPFGAIATGRNRLVPGELPWVGIAIGAAAGIGIYLLHPTLFG